MAKKNSKKALRTKARHERKKARRQERAAEKAMESSVVIIEPATLVELESAGIIVRPTAEKVRLAKDYGLEIKGALTAALEDRFADACDFLTEAKRLRKELNRLISQPRLKIKRTVIRRLEEALDSGEREAKAERPHQVVSLRGKPNFRRGRNTRRQTMRQLRQLIGRGFYDEAERLLNSLDWVYPDIKEKYERMIKASRPPQAINGLTRVLKRRRDGRLQHYNKKLQISRVG